jgi:hypothetical protein
LAKSYGKSVGFRVFRSRVKERIGGEKIFYIGVLRLKEQYDIIRGVGGGQGIGKREQEKDFFLGKGHIAKTTRRRSKS